MASALSYRTYPNLMALNASKFAAEKKIRNFLCIFQRETLVQQEAKKIRFYFISLFLFLFIFFTWKWKDGNQGEEKLKRKVLKV